MQCADGKAPRRWERPELMRRGANLGIYYGVTAVPDQAGTLGIERKRNLDGSIVRGIQNNYIAERNFSIGVIRIDSKNQFIVLGHERISGDDLVPASLWGIVFCKGVLGERSIIQADRKSWQSHVPSTGKRSLKVLA